ncbi:hypothetical protein [Oceanobacillus manasiensis]|uniref:hypothetical protein n=1 Tax=Oceanobacillus manasiensis TaxID=586413 RepID=UPI0005A93C76|nr:hypothetical protein [Oceanobacillus manasiensis]
MDKDKLVVLWEDGKQVKIKVNTTSRKLSEPQSKEETAASVERIQRPEEVPLYTRKVTNQYESKSNKRNRWVALKPILITIASALGVGTLLGVILLQMFSSIDPELPTNSNAAVPAEVETADEENKNAEIAFESMSAFVLQAGVFSGRENAAEWAETYKESGVSTVLWEKDNQFYLLAGIAQDKEGAIELRDEITKDGLEFYVKQWSTEAGKLKVSEENKGWLEQLQTNWLEARNELTNERPLDKEVWENLNQALPTDPSPFTSLADEVRNTAKLAESLTAQEAQHQLLLLWNLYTNAVEMQ